MNRKVKLLGVLVLAAAIIWALAIGTGAKSNTTKASKQRNDRVQVTASMSYEKVIGVDPQFATFAELVKLSDLDEKLGGGSGHTILAPSTDAFTRESSLVALLRADPGGLLSTTLQRHVLDRRLNISELAALDGKTVTTIGGEQLPVAVQNGTVTIGGVRIAKSDIDTREGIIDVLDGVIGAPEPAG